jgi:mono/diheme cytochrome c family protein
MRRGVPLIALAWLAACNVKDEADSKQAAAPSAGKGAPAGPPPPPPPYQMRPEAPSGSRLATSDGKRAFELRCGYCHLAGGMGTNLLIKQRIAAGEGPEMALLANRKDLAPDYIKTVVRQGKNAMPPQTRVDITDAELDAVAAYLGKAK